VIFNVVNTLLLRPYCSGKPWMLSEENWKLYKEGVDTYKAIREQTKNMLPFFPLGFTTFKSPVLAYGLKDEKKAYLSVFAPYGDHGEVPLKHVEGFKSLKVLYPKSGDCDYCVEDGVLKVKFPQNACARTFELEF